jgi:hypothetical protein
VAVFANFELAKIGLVDSLKSANFSGLDGLMWELMAIDDAPDKIKTKNGTLAWKAPWIAELAFLARFNDPLIGDQIAGLADKLEWRHLHVINDFYSFMNGLSIFGSQFCIFGLSSILIDRSDYLNIQNIPFDIENLNKIWRPKFAPDGLMLLASFGDGLEDYIDGVDENGNIVSGKFKHSSTILCKWPSYEKWMTQRYFDAAHSYEVRYPGTLSDKLHFFDYAEFGIRNLNILNA